ncbi:hypothetical protein DFA_04778 [Cavenderia fasciculata]|uniref:Fibronectin type-III domain-containing protein n=1 Tax=Cavenderia fasciculata TaxID=261658 RepID=F4PQI5_CACFS|nr:uncharacterized protein DFA_04778 [Cavenderia fasciculata]EGG22648.1 hypothetical protein DFA_04778 [Cavenderia fasciculata]|eukprot:XP_004360499.1 hypothetical protein DFA_04778 [Cavenderia fasciculata]
MKLFSFLTILFLSSVFALTTNAQGNFYIHVLVYTSNNFCGAPSLVKVSSVAVGQCYPISEGTAYKSFKYQFDDLNSNYQLDAYSDASCTVGQATKFSTALETCNAMGLNSYMIKNINNLLYPTPGFHYYERNPINSECSGGFYTARIMIKPDACVPLETFETGFGMLSASNGATNTSLQISSPTCQSAQNTILGKCATVWPEVPFVTVTIPFYMDDPLVGVNAVYFNYANNPFSRWFLQFALANKQSSGAAGQGAMCVPNSCRITALNAATSYSMNVSITLPYENYMPTPFIDYVIKNYTTLPTPTLEVQDIITSTSATFIYNHTCIASVGNIKITLTPNVSCSSPTNNSFFCYGLEPSTTYSYGINVLCVDYPVNSIRSFTTLAALQKPNIWVKQINTTAFNVTYPASGGVPGGSSYDVDIEGVGSIYSNTTLTNVVVNITNNIDPSGYNVQVVARNNNMTQTNYFLFQFKTLLIIEDVKFKAEQTTLNVTWMVNDTETPVERQTFVAFSTSLGGAYTQRCNITLRESFNCIIDGLSPDTLYYIQITLRDIYFEDIVSINSVKTIAPPNNSSSEVSSAISTIIVHQQQQSMLLCLHASSTCNIIF